jgi:hypothetical protein
MAKAAQKIFELKPEHTKEIYPDKIIEGVLYISDEFKLCSHLCPCGCGNLVTVPFNRDDSWELIEKNGLVTLRPSIGYIKLKRGYHTHYKITRNKIRWI